MSRGVARKNYIGLKFLKLESLILLYSQLSLFIESYHTESKSPVGENAVVELQLENGHVFDILDSSVGLWRGSGIYIRSDRYCAPVRT